MHAPTLRHNVLAILSCAAVLLLLGANAPAAADPVRVTGTVFIDSAGGDFPDIPQPIDELIYFLSGSGLPEARGEVFETSAVHGTHGGLVVARPPVPEPLLAGSSYDLSTRATFTMGQAIESTFPDSGRGSVRRLLCSPERCWASRRRLARRCSSTSFAAPGERPSTSFSRTRSFSITATKSRRLLSPRPC